MTFVVIKFSIQNNLVISFSKCPLRIIWIGFQNSNGFWIVFIYFDNLRDSTNTSIVIVVKPFWGQCPVCHKRSLDQWSLHFDRLIEWLIDWKALSEVTSQQRDTVKFLSRAGLAGNYSLPIKAPTSLFALFNKACLWIHRFANFEQKWLKILNLPLWGT